MSEFLLFHDNESGGKPATVKKVLSLQFFHQKIIQKDQLSSLNLMTEKL